jgi:hypothetical protein
MNKIFDQNEDFRKINLFKIKKILMKKKFHITFYSIFFSFLLYFFFFTIFQKFETSSRLNSVNNIPFHLFDDYENKDLLKKNFLIELSKNLSSVTNFTNFIEKHPDGKKFKVILSQKKLSINQYLEDNNFYQKPENILISNHDQISLEYVFRYPKEINGHNILNDYIEETSNAVFINFINSIKIMIVEDISKFSFHLDLAQKIDLKKNLNIINAPDFLYLRGSIALSAKVEKLHNDLNKIEKLEALHFYEFKWNPILKKAAIPDDPMNSNKFLIIFICFFWGIIFAVIIIFAKSIYFKIKK